MTVIQTGAIAGGGLRFRGLRGPAAVARPYGQAIYAALAIALSR
jgi:hypothetical protein